MFTMLNMTISQLHASKLILSDCAAAVDLVIVACNTSYHTFDHHGGCDILTLLHTFNNKIHHIQYHNTTTTNSSSI